MQPGNTEEFSRTASHLLPGHSLFSSSLDPFYFSPNAVHFAALDTLIDFTSKVCVHGTVYHSGTPLIWTPVAQNIVVEVSLFQRLKYMGKGPI